MVKLCMRFWRELRGCAGFADWAVENSHDARSEEPELAG